MSVWDIVFVGVACIDYIASTSSYPAEDAKVRSNHHLVAGGGNAANSASAAAKLGVPCAVLSKVGADAHGQLVKQQLADAGVETELLLQSDATPTAFTYVLVSEATQTRTCIHTPATETLTVAEVSSMLRCHSSKSRFTGCKVVHFDSRHTDAAVHLAEQLSASAAEGVHMSSTGVAGSVPPQQLLTIDLEKERPHLYELLPHCHIFFTNQHAPENFVPAGADRIDSIIGFFQQPWAQSCVCVVSTMGSVGSVLVRECFDDDDDEQQQQQQQRMLLSQWLGQLQSDSFSGIDLPLTVQQRAIDGRRYEIITCGACDVPAAAVVDTTGAGDTYIGVFLCALLWGCPLSSCMRLATLAAAHKLRALGARDGQPASYEQLVALAAAHTSR